MELGRDARFVEVVYPDGSALEVDVDAHLRMQPGVAEALADWLMSMPGSSAAAEALRRRLTPLGLTLRERGGSKRLELEVHETPKP